MTEDSVEVLGHATEAWKDKICKDKVTIYYAVSGGSSGFEVEFLWQKSKA